MVIHTTAPITIIVKNEPFLTKFAEKRHSLILLFGNFTCFIVLDKA